jgi:hypothetical protein
MVYVLDFWSQRYKKTREEQKILFLFFASTSLADAIEDAFTAPKDLT